MLQVESRELRGGGLGDVKDNKERWRGKREGGRGVDFKERKRSREGCGALSISI